ncbi:MAG: hypothetical protein ACE5FK_05555 [Candidatus Methylomirabilia bacterium]
MAAEMERVEEEEVPAMTEQPRIEQPQKQNDENLVEHLFANSTGDALRVITPTLGGAAIAGSLVPVAPWVLLGATAGAALGLTVGILSNRAHHKHGTHGHP